MKKFVFSLQKILDLRDFEKKQAQVELGRALADEKKIQDTLDMTAQLKIQSVKEADGMKDLNALAGVSNYFKLLDQRKEKLLSDLAAAKLVTEEKRASMVEAMQKCKALEKLKENRYAAWSAEAKKIEENTIDDIVTSKYNTQNI